MATPESELLLDRPLESERKLFLLAVKEKILPVDKASEEY
jgi:hypothetical protein